MQAYFDILTVCFYLLLGLISVMFISQIMRPARVALNRGVTIYNKGQRRACLSFIFVFTFFATFRLVSGEIGGTDAMNYIKNFETILKGSVVEINIGRDLEPGFQIFTRTIRVITSDYHIYFFIVYGFICYSYLKFIKEKCPQGLIYTPFILIMYLYLRSFNTLRTSMAVGLVLIGLAMMDKKKWVSLLFIVSSVFIHRISLIFAIIWPFYFFLKNKLYNLSKVQFVLVTGIGIIGLYFAAMMVQSLIGVSIDLEDQDVYYATHSMGENHFERYPLVIGHLLLYVVLVFYYNKIKWDSQSTFLRTIFIYDFFMVPIGVVFGIWRFVEYFYLVRLSLWSIIIFSIAKRRNKSEKEIIYFSSLLVFGAWLYFRISKEWDQIYISPYILDLF